MKKTTMIIGAFALTLTGCHTSKKQEYNPSIAFINAMKDAGICLETLEGPTGKIKVGEVSPDNTTLDHIIEAQQPLPSGSAGIYITLPGSEELSLD